MENRLPIVADWSVLRDRRPQAPLRGRRLGIVLLSILAAALLPWIVSSVLGWMMRPHHGLGRPHGKEAGLWLGAEMAQWPPG